MVIRNGERLKPKPLFEVDWDEAVTLAPRKCLKCQLTFMSTEPKATRRICPKCTDNPELKHLSKRMTTPSKIGLRR